MQNPLTILLSPAAAENFGDQIRHVLKDRPFRLVDLAHESNEQGDFGVDIGLLSPDVRGNYGTGRPSPTMTRFFEMVMGSQNLQWIHINSAGADRAEYKTLRARKVKVTSSSGATAEAVALSAIGGLIALARHFPMLIDAQHRRAWEPLRGDREPQDLPGQTALVIGTGPIGCEIARLMHALKINVIGMRRSPSGLENFDEMVTFPDLHATLPSVDWVVLCCPLTETTHGFIDAKAISCLPRGARLINVARGNVVNEDDLIQALESGQLGGAYLDVFRHEPLTDASPLWSMPNVMVSPHSASYSNGYFDRVGEIFLENLALWRDGKVMRNEFAP